MNKLKLDTPFQYVIDTQNFAKLFWSSELRRIPFISKILFKSFQFLFNNFIQIFFRKMPLLLIINIIFLRITSK